MVGAPDPTELLDVAVRVAAEGAELAVASRAEGLRDVASKSTATDLVTAADRAVERLVTQRLRAHRPYDLILGEEYGGILGEEYGGAEPSTAGGPGGVRWVVDPIDGTVNYVYGLPQYAVSIAAQVDGESLVAVVRNAATGEQWTALRGGGSWRNGVRLTGSTTVDLGRSLIATGFGYAAERRAHQARVLSSLLPMVRDIRRFGAASLDLCYTAEGLVDAFFEKGLGEWDHAAGGLVASEAGLRVTGLRGAPPGPRMVLAAPPALHGPLHDVLVRLDADGGP